MFENQTQETILERMIEEAGSEVPVFEGTLVYSALSLCAVALEDAYDKLEEIYLNAFEDTCDREHLIRFARKKNLFPYQATKARYIVSANVSLTSGDELTDGEKNFTAISNGSPAVIECETPGKEGNTISGDLSPVTYIEGFENCTVLSQIVKGEDEEETESFRERYLDALNVKPQYGNIRGYKEITENIEGVGKAYVGKAVFSGTAGVAIYITDENYEPASEELVQKVQNIIDPGEGDGTGLASIFHRVAVAPAKTRTGAVIAKLTLDESAVREDVYNQISAIIDSYAHELNAMYGGDEPRIMRRGNIESQVSSLKGVTDFYIDHIIGSAENYVIPEDSLVKISGVQLI